MPTQMANIYVMSLKSLHYRSADIASRGIGVNGQRTDGQTGGRTDGVTTRKHDALCLPPGKGIQYFSDAEEVHNVVNK